MSEYRNLLLHTVLMKFVAALGICMGSLKASRKQHLLALHNVMRQPWFFFESNPLGRILNRFSKELDTMDVLLPELWKMFFQGLTDVCNALAS